MSCISALHTLYDCIQHTTPRLAQLEKGQTAVREVMGSSPTYSVHHVYMLTGPTHRVLK